MNARPESTSSESGAPASTNRTEGWVAFKDRVQRIIESGGCECPTQVLHIEHVIGEAEQLWRIATLWQRNYGDNG